MRVIEMSMERRRNERAGKTGDPRENPLTDGIARHDSHLGKSCYPAGDFSHVQAVPELPRTPLKREKKDIEKKERKGERGRRAMRRWRCSGFQVFSVLHSHGWAVTERCPWKREEPRKASDEEWGVRGGQKNGFHYPRLSPAALLSTRCIMDKYATMDVACYLTMALRALPVPTAPRCPVANTSRDELVPFMLGHTGIDDARRLLASRILNPCYSKVLGTTIQVDWEEGNDQKVLPNEAVRKGAIPNKNRKRIHRRRMGDSSMRTSRYFSDFDQRARKRASKSDVKPCLDHQCNAARKQNDSLGGHFNGCSLRISRPPKTLPERCFTVDMIEFFLTVVPSKLEPPFYGFTPHFLSERAQRGDTGDAREVGWIPVGTPRPRSRSEEAIRAILTRTSSVSSLLRARRAVFPPYRCSQRESYRTSRPIIFITRVASDLDGASPELIESRREEKSFESTYENCSLGTSNNCDRNSFEGIFGGAMGCQDECFGVIDIVSEMHPHAPNKIIRKAHMHTAVLEAVHVAVMMIVAVDLTLPGGSYRRLEISSSVLGHGDWLCTASEIGLPHISSMVLTTAHYHSRLPFHFVMRPTGNFQQQQCVLRVSEEIWVALNVEVLRANEDSPTSGIVQHNSHLRKSGVNRPKIEPGLPWWETSSLTAHSLLYKNRICSLNYGRPDEQPPSHKKNSKVFVLHQTAEFRIGVNLSFAIQNESHLQLHISANHSQGAHSHSYINVSVTEGASVPVLFMLPEAVSWMRLTTAGHTHLRNPSRCDCPTTKDAAPSVTLAYIGCVVLIFSAPDYWPVERESVTAVLKMMDFKHIYGKVTFTFGSQFIQHALNVSEPIAGLQGNTQRVPYCQVWCNTGYSLEPQPMNTHTPEPRVYTRLWSLTYRSLNSRNFPIPNNIVKLSARECGALYLRRNLLNSVAGLLLRPVSYYAFAPLRLNGTRFGWMRGVTLVWRLAFTSMYCAHPVEPERYSRSGKKRVYVVHWSRFGACVRRSWRHGNAMLMANDQPPSMKPPAIVHVVTPAERKKKQKATSATPVLREASWRGNLQIFPAQAFQTAIVHKHTLPLVLTVSDTSWVTVALSSSSTVTASNQCAVDIGIFVHKTAGSSLQRDDEAIVKGESLDEASRAKTKAFRKQSSIFNTADVSSPVSRRGINLVFTMLARCRPRSVRARDGEAPRARPSSVDAIDGSTGAAQYSSRTVLIRGRVGESSAVAARPCGR
ncbi:hypothetical protein PR048_028153 [Dryococelus australis]|uniref:Uncharacterized protein n=1 Tax=Dryococelus australis TaxID=614101 RepID=A0ABQ9GIG0_9NEOP|nr:hypothetical protein PR048_028153 [Dryococelus australis]